MPSRVDLLENAADLTGDDGLVRETEKNPDADADLPEPDQDPNFVPASTVDEDGRDR